MAHKPSCSYFDGSGECDCRGSGIDRFDISISALIAAIKEFDTAISEYSLKVPKEEVHRHLALMQLASKISSLRFELEHEQRKIEYPY